MAHVTFIHGIGNKPEKEKLRDIWLRALSNEAGGIDLGGEGISSKMVYWADVLYEEPDVNVLAYESTAALTPKDVDADAHTRAPVTSSSEEASFITGLSVKIGATLGAAEAVEALPPNRLQEGIPYERVPLPWPVKKAFLDTFLRDVHHYLFNVNFSPRPGDNYKVRDEIRKRFVAAIDEGANFPGPHIVISHSMGTVIAYDCLKRVEATKKIDALVTIGSPLGIDEVQDKLLPEWTRENGFPSDRISRAWINIFDRLDPVDGFDPFISNDYQSAGQSRVKDVEVSNEGAWRHSIVKYLRAPQLRSELAALLGLTQE